MIKKMMAILGAVALLASPTVSLANTVDVSGLTPQQIAEIQQQVENKKSETPEGKVRSAVEKANEWVDIGEGIGAGVAAAARETGQVVNEFATTPVGKMTTFVILYKVIGKDILSAVVGTIALAIFITIWVTYTYRFFSKQKKITYGEGKSKVVEYRDRDFSESHGFTMFISVVVFLAVSAGLIAVIL